MIISQHEQRTPEWHQERLALPTASRFNEIITPGGKLTKPEKRENYLYELLGEYETKRPSERFVSWKMKRASEREPLAKLDYQLFTGNELQEVGLCYKDEQKMFGSSPDGLVNPNGGFETKDAEAHIQVRRRIQGWRDWEDHYPQCQGGMLVCSRDWWDLQSWCEGTVPIIKRIWRDDGFIKTLEEELKKFCDELYRLIRKSKEV